MAGIAKCTNKFVLDEPVTIYTGFSLSAFLRPLYGKNTQSCIEFWSSILKKYILFFVQINQDLKIAKLIKLLEIFGNYWNYYYSFGILLEQWMTSEYALWHLNITKVLTLAVLITPSNAEVERTFSLMKLIHNRIRKRLSHENPGAFMRICKYKELCDCDFQKIQR